MPTTDSLDNILNLLYAGERLRISFPSASAQETFRKNLYEKKAKIDLQLSVLLEQEKKILRFQKEFLAVGKESIFRTTIWIEKEQPVREISFEILDKEEEIEKGA